MNSKDIYVIYSDDIRKMTRTLLDSIDLASDIGDRAKSIVLKPNLVVSVTPDSGATTHTEIISELISYLKEKGFSDITIAESAWVGDSTIRGFKVNHYEDFNVPLVDIKADEYRRVTKEGITMELSEVVLNADYVINLPVLKGHCQTNMTCAMKNLKGIMSDRSKRLFHQKGLMHPIAALNAAFKPSITIVDGICGDLDFEEGGNPVISNRMFAAKDSVLMDAYAASLLGFCLDDVPYIELGEEFGAGCSRVELANIIELNKPTEAKMLTPKGEVKRLASFTDAADACSACYANLIHALKRMDQEGMLSQLRGRKICIGQAYRGKEVELGVGACCSKARRGVKGCPPSANDILQMLTSSER